MKNPHENTQVDKLRFQNNKVSQLLVIGALAFLTIGMFRLINYDDYASFEPKKVIPDFYIALDIAFGILNLLILFLASEKVKYYDKNWSLFGVFIMATLNLIRIFLTPIYALNKSFLSIGVYIQITVLMSIGVIMLLIAGIFATQKYLKLSHHKREIERWEQSN